MRDYNSISEGERYFNTAQVDIPVGVSMLDISRDIPNYFVREQCFSMTHWMINQSVKQNLCEYRGFNHSVKELLLASKRAGDKVCIILAQGMMAPRLYKIINKTATYFRENPNFFVVGHIMAKQERYPGLHRQMLIVNIETWERLGEPEFLEQGFFWDRIPTYPNYTLSEETMSADYTPAWIAPSSGTQKCSVVEDGSNWIALALENNIVIDNLDFEMRECKAFLYPYEDSDLLEKA